MKEQLEKLGFSPKEADVYLALLELGTAVVSDVAKKANINRSTTYILLDALPVFQLVAKHSFVCGQLFPLFQYFCFRNFSGFSI